MNIHHAIHALTRERSHDPHLWRSLIPSLILALTRSSDVPPEYLLSS